MTRFRLGLVGLSSLLGVLGGCAAAPNGSGAANSTPAVTTARPIAPGPGWLLLGTYGDGAVYIHPHSTLRAGSSVFILVMATKNQPAVLPSGAAVGSLREHIEVDCAKARYRRHDGTVHPDQGAAGPVLGRVGRDQWREVVPGTVMAAVALAVCSGPAPDADDAPPGPSAPRFSPNRGRTFRT